MSDRWAICRSMTAPLNLLLHHSACCRNGARGLIWRLDSSFLIIAAHRMNWLCGCSGLRRDVGGSSEQAWWGCPPAWGWVGAHSLVTVKISYDMWCHRELRNCTHHVKIRSGFSLLKMVSNGLVWTYKAVAKRAVRFRDTLINYQRFSKDAASWS